MDGGIIIFFDKLKKIKYNFVFLCLLIAMLVVGIIVYSSFIKIRHNTETILLKSYGQYDLFCDSITVNLFAVLPRFDTSTYTNCTDVFFHNRTPDKYYYYLNKDFTVDSLSYTFLYNGKYQSLDSIFLSEEEIQEINNTFSHSIPDGSLASLKGVMLLQYVYSGKGNCKNISSCKTKQKDFSYIKHGYSTVYPRNSNCEHELIIPFSIPTNKDYIDTTMLRFTFPDMENRWLHFANFPMPIYPTFDSLTCYSNTLKTHQKTTIRNTLIEIFPWPGDTISTSFSINKKYEFIYANDISQEAIDISLFCDSETPKKIKIKTFAIPFEDYPDFTYLFPQPDSIGEKIIYYTDPHKIEQIKNKGVHAFVKYPERQNRQTARIFIMTMILSLLVTGIINQVIKLIKDLKVIKTFQDKTKSCATSALNCNDCPLISQCEHFKPNMPENSPEESDARGEVSVRVEEKR